MLVKREICVFHAFKHWQLQFFSRLLMESVMYVFSKIKPLTKVCTHKIVLFHAFFFGMVEFTCNHRAVPVAIPHTRFNWFSINNNHTTIKFFISFWNVCNSNSIKFTCCHQLILSVVFELKQLLIERLIVGRTLIHKCQFFCFLVGKFYQ